MAARLLTDGASCHARCEACGKPLAAASRAGTDLLPLQLRVFTVTGRVEVGIP
jgi:hypothetical protein